MEPEKDNKVQTEEKNTKKDDKKSKDLQDKKVVSKKENLKEEKAIMQEESKTNPLNSESKNNFQNVHKTSFVHKTNSKPNMKIDILCMSQPRQKMLNIEIMELKE